MKNDKQEEQVLKRLASIYRPGTLNLIGGRPGMGKTTLAFQLATEAQLPTAYFSLEMKRDQLLLRHAAGKCPEWIRLDDTATLTVDSIREKVRQLRETYDIRWVIIDYLQLVSSSQPYPNREDEIVNIIKELKKNGRRTPCGGHRTHAVDALGIDARRLSPNPSGHAQLGPCRRMGG